MASALETLARQFRADLLADDRRAAATILDAYRQVWDRLAVDLDALTADIAAARAAGEAPSAGWLLRQDRYRALMAQTEAQLDRWAAAAGDTIAASQYRAYADGWRNSGALIGAQTPRVGLSFDVLPADALAEMVGTLTDGSPLSTLLGQLGGEAAAAMRSALIVGTALGQSPREIAAGVARAANVAPARALTIARTETLRAYRTASLQRFAANGDILDGWMWSAQKGRRTCPVCLAKDGSIHPLDEPFASHPNCRCVPIPIVAGSDALSGYQSGADWFAERDAADQRAILGDAKQRAYAAGDLTLADLVGETHSARWGPGLRERTLAEALRADPLAAD